MNARPGHPNGTGAPPGRPTAGQRGVRSLALNLANHLTTTADQPPGDRRRLLSTRAELGDYPRSREESQWVLSELRSVEREQHVYDLLLRASNQDSTLKGRRMPFGYNRFDYDTVSYAVNGEDVILLRAFADCRHGFFVDVGAGDPEEESVTKNLVDRLNWRGINIEPLPDLFERLQSVRPNDINLSVAIDTQPGKATFYRILPAPGLQGGTGLSTLDFTVAQMHRQTGWGAQEMEVDVVTLEAIFAEHAYPGFDLLKVDVEGREASVLASADLAFWRPRVLVVEATVPDSPEPSHQEWEKMVLDKGYSFALFDGLNRFYARDNEPELLKRLSVPVNVFDRWIPVAWVGGRD